MKHGAGRYIIVSGRDAAKIGCGGHVYRGYVLGNRNRRSEFSRKRIVNVLG